MSPIEYHLSGYSEDELKVATDKVADYLRTVPEFYMVRTSFKEPLNGVEFPVASLWEGDRKVPVGSSRGQMPIAPTMRPLPMKRCIQLHF